jgi:hypothetical protein
MIGAAIAAGLYAVSHKPGEVISAREAERTLATEQAERRPLRSVFEGRRAA